MFTSANSGSMAFEASLLPDEEALPSSCKGDCLPRVTPGELLLTRVMCEERTASESAPESSSVLTESANGSGEGHSSETGSLAGDVSRASTI